MLLGKPSFFATALLLSSIFACEERPEIKPPEVRPAPITLDSLADIDSSIRIHADDGLCIRILPGGGVGECMASQCAPEVSGGWKIESSVLIVRYGRKYAPAICMGQKRPFAQDLKVFKFKKMKCEFYGKSSCKGEAVTTDEKSFQIFQ